MRKTMVRIRSQYIISRYKILHGLLLGFTILEKAHNLIEMANNQDKKNLLAHCQKDELIEYTFYVQYSVPMKLYM
jgi:hypothetical protein